MTVQRQLDGPSKHLTLTVTSTTVQELKSDSTPIEKRKVISFQPSEFVYVYFGDDTGTVPSTATMASDGFEYTPNGLFVIEASDSQPVYIVAKSTTATVRMADRA